MASNDQLTLRALLFVSRDAEGDPAPAEIRTGGDELLIPWRNEPDSLLWIDITGDDDDVQRRYMTDTLGLHPMAVQDALSPRHPPKIESFEDHALLLLKGLGGDSECFEYDTIQLALFVGERFLITRRSAPSRSTDAVWEEAQTQPAWLTRGPGAIALRLARRMVDRYVAKLLSLEPRLEALEQAMATHPSDDMLAELTGYKTDLRKFRRTLLYHEQIFSQLRAKPLRHFNHDFVHEINDVYEQQERASSLATLYYELATDLIEGHISLSSHRLNHIMKILTIVTAIFVPLSFLAGIYGMNFENMPELHSRAGYFILLGIMATIAFTLLMVFRRKRWL